MLRMNRKIMGGLTIDLYVTDLSLHVTAWSNSGFDPDWQIGKFYLKTLDESHKTQHYKLNNN